MHRSKTFTEAISYTLSIYIFFGSFLTFSFEEIFRFQEKKVKKEHSFHPAKKRKKAPKKCCFFSRCEKLFAENFSKSFSLYKILNLCEVA